MAKKFYRGINNKATEMKKFYIGVGNKAKRVVKMYIGIDNVAKICYELTKITISYVTNLTSSFTSKTAYIGDKYNLPTISPTNSNREDFWFDSTATAKNDSSKKYIDYPWCAYADANASVYSSYGYKQDLLAKHWNETGRGKGLNKGSVTSNTIITSEQNHTLQHVYRPKVITLTASETEGISGHSFVDIQDSNNKLIEISKSGTYNIYPGMTLIFHARYDSGLGSDDGGNHACKVTLDGKILGYRGASYWKVPDNIKAIKVNLAVDNHVSPLLARSFIITATTTKL